MPQSLSRIWLHIIFSTKERRPFLRDDTIREEMFRMLGHQVHQEGGPVARVGGWHDHVQVLCGLARTLTVAELVEGVKTETSKWIKHRSPRLSAFHWQNGYGAFSVSQSQVDSVIDYLKGQPEHHRRLTFQEEYRAICAKHEIGLDERFVWD